MSDNDSSDSKLSGLRSAVRAAVSTRRAQHVSTKVNYPKLLRADPESIRWFLDLYDQYVTEVQARARQFIDGNISTETSKPVDLKCFVDIDFLRSTIALGEIPGVKSYDNLTSKVLRKYLDNETAESHSKVTVESLDSLIKRGLRMYMRNKDVTSRMKTLFVDCQTVLRKNGLSWVVTENPKVAVQHILTAILPAKLRTRLSSDMELVHKDLKKDFAKFYSHAKKLSEAYGLVESGALDEEIPPEKPPKKRDGNNDKNNETSDANKSGWSGGNEKRPQPLCFWEPHRSQAIRHKMYNCKECPRDVKKNLLAEWARQRAIDGPATNTRRGGRELGPPKTPKHETPTARRLQGSSSTSPSCNATVSDGLATISATARCDDGSDDSIALPRLAGNAVVKGIGRIIAINPIRISVALRKGEEGQEFKFSSKWIAPRTILQLSIWQLALTNISFLVANDDLACEDILIGLPVLRHLKIDSRTLFESLRDILYGADCSDVGNPTTNACGSVGRLMIARLQTVKGKSYQHGLDYSQRSSQPQRYRPRVDYYETRVEPDPYPDPSLLDPIDSDQHEEIEAAVKQMLEIAHNNGLHPKAWERLKSAVHDHIDVFRVGLSRGPPAKLPPLKIELTSNAAPVKVKLRNYTQDQREFLRQMTSRLVDARMAYPNPAARWASAPLIVPKPGTSKFRFTVDLRLVNRFTIPHHYPMPLL